MHLADRIDLSYSQQADRIVSTQAKDAQPFRCTLSLSRSEAGAKNSSEHDTMEPPNVSLDNSVRRLKLNLFTVIENELHTDQTSKNVAKFFQR